MADLEGSEKNPTKIPPAPPNFEAEQEIQEDLRKEAPDAYAKIKQQKRQELEVKAKNPPEIFDPSKRVFPGKTRRQHKPQYSPTQISPVKMADDWNRATNSKGRPPIGGAPDD